MAKKSVAELAAIVRGEVGGRVWLGIDVHKSSYQVAMMTRDGREATWSSVACPHSLVTQVRGLGVKVALAVYEAGPTGFGLARALRSAGIAVCVAAPSRVVRPVSAGAKTDRLDCLKLAEYGAKGMVKSIAIPSESEEAERSLLRRRHQLVDELRRTKQRIKSHLLCLGVEEPSGLKGWSRRGVAELKELSLPREAKWTLESLVRELEYVMGEQAVVERQLACVMETPRHQEVFEALRSVPGVGPVVATSWCLELFRPQRFLCGEELASYLGLAPVVRQSGSGKARARIRPVGKRRLRSLLVEAAWLWRAWDPWAAQWYRRCLARTGVFQKAITALARKLAIILWRLSVERRPYRPGLANA